LHLLASPKRPHCSAGGTVPSGLGL
jgi:hypothetical protein